MNLAAADLIAKAVLYEGYMLYPYRPSAVKNQQRFNFGVVYPQAFSEAQCGPDPWTVQSECVVQGSDLSRLEVHVRYLQLVERSVEELVSSEIDGQPAEFRPVKKLMVDGRTFYSWQEAIERDVQIPVTALADFLSHSLEHSFHMSVNASDEILCDGVQRICGRLVRTQQEIDGKIDVAARRQSDGLFRITVRISNVSKIDHATSIRRDVALSRSLVSAHIVLGVENGEFLSLLEPPDSAKLAVEDCHNVGLFPVLVGQPGQRDTVLASPIILYDYPQIAPESAGDLFDGAEIDEILSLRILTMTEDEKREMRESDERARQMLERTESLPAGQFMKLHGVMRALRNDQGG